VVGGATKRRGPFVGASGRAAAAADGSTSNPAGWSVAPVALETAAMGDAMPDDAAADTGNNRGGKREALRATTPATRTRGWWLWRTGDPTYHFINLHIVRAIILGSVIDRMSAEVSLLRGR